MKSLFTTILLCFSFFTLFSQSGFHKMQIYVAYDAGFLDEVGSHSEAEQLIDDLLNDAQTAYQFANNPGSDNPIDIVFEWKSEFVNKVFPINNGDAHAELTGHCLTKCYERDLNILFVGQAQGKGSAAGRVCKQTLATVNSLNRDIGVIVGHNSSFASMLHTVCHEIGHTVGMGHNFVDTTPGNFMSFASIQGVAPGDVADIDSDNKQSFINTILNAGCLNPEDNPINFDECETWPTAITKINRANHNCSNSNSTEFEIKIDNLDQERTFKRYNFPYDRVFLTFKIVDNGSLDLLSLLESLILEIEDVTILEQSYSWIGNAATIDIEIPGFTLAKGEQKIIKGSVTYPEVWVEENQSQLVITFDAETDPWWPSFWGSSDRVYATGIALNNNFTFDGNITQQDLLDAYNSLGTNLSYVRDYGSFTINGTLEITEDYNLPPEWNIYMENDSKLKINDGVYFSAMKSSFAGCGSSWLGIEVGENSTIVLDECQLEDAFVAVDLDASSKSMIFSTKFINNRISVRKDGGSKFDDFIGNSITSNSQSFHNIHTGLDFNNVGFAIVSNDALSEMSYFKNLDYGIKAINTNCYVFNQKFIDNFIGCYIEGSDQNLFDNNIFIDCGRGIEGWYSRIRASKTIFEGTRINSIASYFGRFDAFENIISSYGNSILLLVSPNSLLLDNHITTLDAANQVNSYGILGYYSGGYRSRVLNNVVNDEFTRRSVQYSNSSDVVIKDNSIFHTASNQSNGVRILGSDDYYLDCNVINGNGQSTEAVGFFSENSPGGHLSCNQLAQQNTNVNIASGSIFQEMKGNEFMQGNIGLWVDEELGRQISSEGQHHGNIWEDNFSEFGAFNNMNQEDFILSQFIVDPSENNQFYTSNNGEGTFFDPQIEDELSYNCQTTLCSGGIGAQLTSWVLSNLEHESVCELVKGMDTLSCEAAWVKKVNVYALIKQATQLDSTFKVKDCLKAAIGNDSLNLVTLYTIDSLLNNHTDTLSYLDETTLILEEQSNQRYTQIEDFQENTVIKPTSVIDLVQIETLISSLSISDSCTYMQQQIKMYDEVMSLYTEKQIKDAEAIAYCASLCAKEYGKAVYTARSLADNFGIPYSEDSNCNGRVNEREKSKDNFASNSKNVIFPNPTSGKLTIHSEYFSTGTVFETNGVEVLQIQSKTVDITHLQAGLYILQVTNTDGSTEVHRIIKY